MKRVLTIVTSLVIIVSAPGCASNDTHQSQFSAATVSAIKSGMTKGEVTTLLGEPRSRSIDNDGNELWQYRKNAQEGKSVKQFANIMSLGLTTGTDAEYQDILLVSFKNNIVLKCAYEENVHNLGNLGGHN